MAYNPEIAINVSKVDLVDVAKMVERQFDDGAEIVFKEEGYAHHKVYITRALMLRLGGSETANELVRLAFNTVDQTDPTKKRFYFGESYKLGRHEVWGFSIYYPEGSYRPLEETQQKFIEAIEKRLRSVN